jgi:hypothetical protein
MMRLPHLCYPGYFEGQLDLQTRSMALVRFSRNQIIGGLLLLALVWVVVILRVLSSGT